MIHGVEDTGPVRGRVDRIGRLIAADPLLDALHRRAGGLPGEGIAVPQIAAVARLAWRLGIVVSRAVVAADGPDDIDLWVRAQPGEDAVDLAIAGWRRRPPAPPAPARAEERLHDFLRADADWTWETDAALTLRPLAPDLADRLGADAAGLAGQPLTRLFTLFEAEDGTLPILLALARREMFSGQMAELKVRPGVPLTLAGVALIASDGRFVGLRGIATAARDTAEHCAAPNRGADAWPDGGQGAGFSRRLDAVLRVPLDRIIAQAESIRSQKDGPLRRDYADYADDIASAGRHLLGLVDDLADLQTIEGAEFTPVRQPIDLVDVARRAVGLLAVSAAERSVTIQRSSAIEPLPALAEHRRALQIAANLIANAIHYSPAGGSVGVRCERAGGNAVLIVADQGRGIAPADQARIFDKFGRVDPQEPGGTGLGLYIARRLARAMGGDIVVESAAGAGARFSLILPAAAA